jgi:hypothetical protein
MEASHWKNGQLFDDSPYIHRFTTPNVVPLPTREVVNTGHDDAFDYTPDDVEADKVRALIFDFPRRIVPPDEAA